MLDLTQQTPSVRWRAEEEQLGSWEDPAGSELLHFSFAVPLLELFSPLHLSVAVNCLGIALFPKAPRTCQGLVSSAATAPCKSLDGRHL